MRNWDRDDDQAGEEWKQGRDRRVPPGVQFHVDFQEHLRKMMDVERFQETDTGVEYRRTKTGWRRVIPHRPRPFSRVGLTITADTPAQAVATFLHAVTVYPWQPEEGQP